MPWRWLQFPGFTVQVCTHGVQKEQSMLKTLRATPIKTKNKHNIFGGRVFVAACILFA
jgi:hypothetical protein